MHHMFFKLSDPFVVLKKKKYENNIDIILIVLHIVYSYYSITEDFLTALEPKCCFVWFLYIEFDYGKLTVPFFAGIGQSTPRRLHNAAYAHFL